MSRDRSSKRTKGDNFALLPRQLIYHPAVSTLTGTAFRVLVLLASQHTGHNNGALGLTHKQAVAGGISTKASLYNALRELQRRQIIEITFPSSKIPSRPTMYALSWFPRSNTQFSSATVVPSHGYKDWVGARKKRRYKKCTSGVSKIEPMAAWRA